jgi:predicted transcriptional regulator
MRLERHWPDEGRKKKTPTVATMGVRVGQFAASQVSNSKRGVTMQNIHAPTEKRKRGPSGIAAEVRAHLAIDPGISYSDLARRLGCNKMTVAYHAKRVGLPPRYKATSPHRPQIKAMNAAGLCDSEIARQLGLCASTVSYIRSKMGLPVRPTFTDIKDHVLAALQLVQNGATYGEAAHALGITRNAVAGAVWRQREAKARTAS